MVILLLGAIVAFPQLGDADSWEPSHSCSKPHKPYEFTSQWQIDSFFNNVARYKNCIEEFIEEQEEAIENHMDASQEAIDDWNSFVNYELN